MSLRTHWSHLVSPTPDIPEYTFTKKLREMPVLLKFWSNRQKMMIWGNTTSFIFVCMFLHSCIILAVPWTACPDDSHCWAIKNNRIWKKYFFISLVLYWPQSVLRAKPQVIHKASCLVKKYICIKISVPFDGMEGCQIRNLKQKAKSLQLGSYKIFIQCKRREINKK